MNTHFLLWSCRHILKNWQTAGTAALKSNQLLLLALVLIDSHKLFCEPASLQIDNAMIWPVAYCDCKAPVKTVVGLHHVYLAKQLFSCMVTWKKMDFAVHLAVCPELSRSWLDSGCCVALIRLGRITIEIWGTALNPYKSHQNRKIRVIAPGSLISRILCRVALYCSERPKASNYLLEK